ncbi:hypothetical protein QR680_018334 [Steinernema hermaphroditum]|uniref:Uncharacterized protein n=1 Tax=Steinernema hermaphroditum TaxID=289476 RepID=A0AA39HHM2_9BILA|nr:hypothetical protein QR680_018334 [Steinernema hermaphroditum]
MHWTQTVTAILQAAFAAGTLCAFALPLENPSRMPFGLIGLVNALFSVMGIWGILTKQKIFLRVVMYMFLAYVFLVPLLMLLLPLTCSENDEKTDDQRAYVGCLVESMAFGIPISAAALVVCAITFFMWKTFLFENRDVYFET